MYYAELIECIVVFSSLVFMIIVSGLGGLIVFGSLFFALGAMLEFFNLYQFSTAWLKVAVILGVLVSIKKVIKEANKIMLRDVDEKSI